jgi:hypothetical protein
MGDHSFRGAYVHVWFEKTPLQGSELTVAPDACTQLRVFTSTVIRRSEVSRVWCERRGRPPFGRDVVTFLDRRGNRLGLSFVPIRTDNLVTALTENGWPVRVEHGGLRGWSYPDEAEPVAQETPARWAPGVPWAIACTPLIGVAFGITAVATRSTMLGEISAPVSVVPMWLLSLVLAVIDIRQLRAAGRTPTPQEYALLGPCIYLLARALRSRDATPKTGWPQVAVAVVLTVLTVSITQLALHTTADLGNSHNQATEQVISTVIQQR